MVLVPNLLSQASTPPITTNLDQHVQPIKPIRMALLVQPNTVMTPIHAHPVSLIIVHTTQYNNKPKDPPIYQGDNNEKDQQEIKNY